MLSARERLDSLYDRIRNDPALAHMVAGDINFVPGIGKFGPTAMLIGEAPGSVENREQEPFKGPAGKKLYSFLERAGIDKNELYFTNVLKFWPLNGDHKTRSPTEDEIRISREYIKEEIEIVDPVYIALLGRTATTALFPNIMTIRNITGKVFDGRYIVLYHPAHALHKPEKTEEILNGYRTLAALIDALE